MYNSDRGVLKTGPNLWLIATEKWDRKDINLEKICNDRILLKADKLTFGSTTYLLLVNHNKIIAQPPDPQYFLPRPFEIVIAWVPYTNHECSALHKKLNFKSEKCTQAR